MLQPLGCVQGAAPGDAGAAAGDKAIVEPLGHLVIEQVMDDAVTEISGPYLAGLGSGDDKTNRAAGAVLTAAQFIVQVDQIGFQPLFKRQGTGGISLRNPTVQVGLNKGCECVWA